MINSIADGNGSSLKYINQKIQELDIEKSNKVAELSKLKLDKFSSDTSNILKYIKNIDERITTSNFEDLKILCKTVIDKVVVNDDKIDIHYKI